MAYYYLNKLDNTYNEYKYFYLDHITTVIEVRESYLYFHIGLVCINDFKLPPNTLIGTLQLPYQEISDIPFNISTNQSDAISTAPQNQKYAHVYSSNFNVNISQNEFFNQDLNNNKISCHINLQIDPQIIRECGAILDQEAIDILIAETFEQKWEFFFYYTNLVNINHEGETNVPFAYYFNKGHGCTEMNQKFNITSNVYINNIDSLIDLAHIKSDSFFQILFAQVIFHYWVENDENEKVLKKYLNLFPIDKYINNFSIRIFDNTLFNYKNNEVYFNSSGVIGFYIPKYSYGYYELQLQIKNEDKLTKFIITNDFEFFNNINMPHIVVNNIEIKNLDGFKEIIFNG